MTKAAKILWFLCLAIFLGWLTHRAFGQTFQRSLPFLAKSVPSGPFKPTDIANLKFWLLPDTNYLHSTNTCDLPIGYTNGANLQCISDATGSGYSVTNYLTDIGITTLNTNGQGIQTNPVFRCNHGQVRMMSVTNVYGSAGMTTWVFVVMYPLTGALNGVSMSPFALGELNALLPEIVLNNTTANLILQNGTLPTLSWTTPPHSTWMLITVESSSNGTVVRTNGVQSASSNVGVNGWSRVMFFANLSSTWNFNGDIAEAFVYNNCSSNDVYKLETYLRDRHPFPYAGP